MISALIRLCVSSLGSVRLSSSFYSTWGNLRVHIPCETRIETERYTASTHGFWQAVTIIVISRHQEEKVTGCKSWHCFFRLCMAWIWLAQYTSLLGLSSSPSALFSATNIHCPFSPSICFLRAHYIIKAIKQ